MRNPLGVAIERAAKRQDDRWRWERGAMEWWDGFDLIYVPFRLAVRRWRRGDWRPW